MSQSQARMLCPEAHLIPANETYYQATIDKMLAVLLDFTDCVELGEAKQSAISWLDMGNLTKEEAAETAQEIGQAVRKTTGLSPAIGLADGKFSARVAAVATEPNKALLVPLGQEAAFLAPFPVGLLPLDSEIARRLKLLGIRQLGQLAALPAGAVLAQFGQSGRQLQQLAQGCDRRPIMPRQPRTIEQVSRQFDSPVADQIALTVVLRAMAETLTTRLYAQERLGREVALTLYLEDRTTATERLVLRQPTGNPDRLTQTLIDLLKRLKIRCGILEISVTVANLVPATGQQLDLFVHQTGQADRLHQALKDLIARYGTDCFYWVSLLDQSARLPERRFRLGTVKVI